MSFVVDISEDSFYENLTLGLVHLLGKFKIVFNLWWNVKSVCPST